jgi:hypothetical protein
MTHVQRKRFVACPFSAAVELAERAANRRSGLYVTPSPPFGEHVRFAVATTPDSTDSARKHDALLIAWRPQTARIFPDFRGALTVRPHGAGVTLQIDGEYEAPYGAVGKLFDRIIGRTLADRTMKRLLDDFARDIEAEYRAEKRERQPT